MRQILFWITGVLLLVEGDIQAQDFCSNNSFPIQATVSRLSSSYGGLDGFYSIATDIANGLHDQLTRPLMQRFANVVEGKDNDISGLVFEVLKKQTGFILFIVIGLIFIIIFPTVGCFYCCCRCCCKKCGAKRYQKVDASETCLVVLIVAVVVCFAFILTGTVIYGKSVQNGEDSIDALNVDALKIASDLDDFALSTGNQLMCGVKISIEGTINNIIDILTRAPNDAITLFTRETGLDSLNNLVSASINISGQFASTLSSSNAAQLEITNINSSLAKLYTLVKQKYQSDSVPSASSAFTELAQISGTLTMINTMIPIIRSPIEDFTNSTEEIADKANAEVQQAQTAVTNKIDSVTNQVNNARLVVDNVVKELRKLMNSTNGYVFRAIDAINTAHKRYEDFGGKNALVVLITVIVLLPCLIVLVLMAVGYACGAAGYRRGRHPPHRTSLSHAAGHAAIATSIFLFAIGGFLMFLSTMLFTVGYAVQFACQPIFYDDTYQLFNFLDQFIPNITNPIDHTVIPININDAITGCANSETIYKTINGDRIFNVDQILSKIQFNASTIDTHIDGNLDFNLSPDQIQQLTTFNGEIGFIQTVLTPFNSPPTRDTTIFLTNLINFLKEKGDPLSGNVSNLITGIHWSLVNDATVRVISMNTTISQVLVDTKFILYNRTSATDAVAQVEQFALNIFSSLNNTAYVSLKGFQYDLNTNIAKCDPLYNTYQNMGDLICKKLGHPLQGMWASLGLAVLFFIPTIIALTLISKYLYRMDREHYPLLTGGIMYNGQRLDRVAPEVINIPRSLISEEPETPINRVLDDRSDEFKYETNGDCGISNKSINLLGAIKNTENSVQ